MAFNRQAAIAAGYSPEEVDSYLSSGKQETSVSKQQPIEAKIAKTGLFDVPVLGGVMRGAENSLESYGRMVGGAGYEGLRKIASVAGKNPYTNPQTGQAVPNPFLDNQDLSTFSDIKTGAPEGLGRTLNAALTLESIAQYKNILKTVSNLPKIIANPKKALGSLREATIGNKTVPTADYVGTPLENLENSKYFKGASPSVQQEARARLAQLMENTVPMETIGNNMSTFSIGRPANIGINQIYKQLIPFEKMGNAYGGTPNASTLVSQAVRPFLTENLPTGAKVLNKVLSTASAMKSPAGKAFKVGGAAGGLLWLKNLLQKGVTSVSGE